MNKILTAEKILSLHITSSYEGMGGMIRGRLNVHRFVKISSVGSNTTYRLREKFVIIHCRKARNLDQFSFRMMKYL